MEDDDEFGDLYTDVLKPFASSSTLQSNPTPTTHPYFQPQPSNPSPVDINLNIASTSSAAALHPGDGDNDADVLRDASNPNFASCSAEERPRNSSNLGASPPNNPKGDHAHVQDLMLSHETQETPEPVQVSLKLNPPAEASSRSRVLDNDDDLNLEVEDIAAVVDEAGAQNFGIDEASAVEEDDRQADDLSLDPVIPGLEFDTGPSVSNAKENENFMGRGEDGDDDWDSDSDDDLQIVLNDDHHHLHDPMAMDRNGMEGSDDEDEDGDPLIIVADDADASHQPADEQVGGEDAAKATEGERKEGADASKVNGGAAMAQKIGYGNYGYHPYHSQFKYVRPGATPLPGGGPGGTPGQVRPPINIGAGAGGGRGRGDWRPAGMKGGPMQKGFHPGFWGGNGSGRGFGGEFTLPSHKTIFEVDIDSFEEKPWNYPGVDVTEFFNFGLNEESWKEYCKQLDQLRMESTSQSKVHVLVGSRTEQEYDPDLPPELAAASGIHDPSAENLNPSKPDAGPSEIPKETARLRPPLPIGRAIQVETGSGERLPSVDTRPPRIRDSDAIIEIVLQGSLDDNSTAAAGAADVPNHDVSGEDCRDDAVEGSGEKEEKEYSDGYPFSDGVKEDLPDKRSPVSIHDEVASPEGPDENHLGSEKADSSYEERQTNVNSCERSASMSPGKSAQEREFLDDKEEEPNERVERENSPLGTSLEERAASEDDESFPAETNYGKEKENSGLSGAVSPDILKDKNTLHSPRKQKLISQVEHKTSKGSDDGIDLKATRSSDNSKATGSSDHRRGHDDIDEEVVQDRHSRRDGELKRQRGEDVQGIRRREFEGSLETEKSYMYSRVREDSCPRRDGDPYSAHNSRGKAVGFDRRKERDYAEGMLARRDEDPHGRRLRTENPPRKQERADEMVSRHKGKDKESVRGDKDEHLHSRKPLENGSWRGYREKDAGLRHREKDDNVKVLSYDTVDDPYIKGRKDDEVARRDHFDKEEIYHALSRENTTRRKREREEALDHHPSRHKDESWPQRERGERHRERDDWYRSKQSHDDTFSRRVREDGRASSRGEDGRASSRGGRNVEEKAWTAHSRTKDEYKDAGRHSEQLKRKDRAEDKNHFGNDEKRSRQERPNVRNDRAPERKHKENSKKAGDGEGGHRVNSGSSKKILEGRSVRSEMADMVGRSEQGNAGNQMSGELPNNSKEEAGGASSDDEQLHNSKKGRSKLERWTSHKERDFGINTKSLKVKEGDKDNYSRSGFSSKQAVQKADEAAKKSEVVRGSNGSGHSLIEGKGGGLLDDKSNKKEADASLNSVAIEDTVAKLKKRSERFKLPLPSEKDTTTIKKMESEPLPPSGQTDAPAAAEVKPERPARKRRWISK